MTSAFSRRRFLHALPGVAPLLGAPLSAWGQAQAGSPEAGAPRGYGVSVVPQFPLAEINRDWTPLLARLSRDSGLPLHLKLSPNIPRFEADVMAGLPDFAFMNPYHAVMAARAAGYVPLVRDSQLLTGILVVRKDNPITSVQGLAGTTVAFPAPNAFGASLWMRALLAEREKVAITPLYSQTHSNVFRQVVRGSVAAGGVINKTLLQEHDEVRRELRVIFETPGAAPHPLCAHPRVPAAAAQALAQALLHLANDAEGRALLAEVALAQPLKADYGRDYRPLESYKLEKYVVL
jgi:phosphonate transport system substrate-binding protein